MSSEIDRLPLETYKVRAPGYNPDDRATDHLMFWVLATDAMQIQAALEHTGSTFGRVPDEQTVDRGTDYWEFELPAEKDLLTAVVTYRLDGTAQQRFREAIDSVHQRFSVLNDRPSWLDDRGRNVLESILIDLGSKLPMVRMHDNDLFAEVFAALVKPGRRPQDFEFLTPAGTGRLLQILQSDKASVVAERWISANFREPTMDAVYAALVALPAPVLIGVLHAGFGHEVDEEPADAMHP